MTYHCIHQLAQAGFAMLHSRRSRSELVAGTSLQSVIVFVNYCVRKRGRDLSRWTAGEQDQIARLLWVNLFYQRLAREPIRKPLLVHTAQDQLHVDCGDTRLMVLDLAQQHTALSTVTIVPVNQQYRYLDWQLIKTNSQLIDLLEFDSSAELAIRIAPNQQWAEWFEIGDETTALHLHDIAVRINLMQQYIDQQSADFEFTESWMRELINWGNT